MLRVAALKKRYEACVALDDVSFDVRAGELVGLLGPNGAGKTTTLECVLGLRHPDAGSITLDGVDLAVNPRAGRARVGAQLQATDLHDKITPRQALRLFGGFYSAAPATDELLAKFSLSAKADARFDTLSAGQRQRLGVALAFVNDPLLLVLDEPTAGLDPLARRDLGELLRRSRDDGKAVLFSTHSLDEAAAWCDRVVILHRGTVVADGPPQSLVDAAAVRPRLRVRLDRPLLAPPEPSLQLLPLPDGAYELAAIDLNPALVSLAQFLSLHARTIVDLRMIRPSLQDVFERATGSDWDAAAPLSDL